MGEGGERERKREREREGGKRDKRKREETEGGGGEKEEVKGWRRVTEQVWYLTQYNINIHDIITVVGPQTHGQLYQLVNSDLPHTHNSQPDTHYPF